MWALLLVTLPTQPNAVRLRIWRSLKALGCAALRDGAYLLPMDHAALLDRLAEEVRDHGGSASVLSLSPRDDVQRQVLLAQFDRGEAYAEWRATGQTLAQEFVRLNETEARRRLRGVAEALTTLLRVDYYPGAAAQQAAAELTTWRAAFDARFSKGEPQARAAAAVAPLKRQQFQGKRWATRARPWVDRLASAWLIGRFIDAAPTFLWLRDQGGELRTPRGALGLDFDGARFSHVGSLVTFEVLMASFALQHDAALQRIAAAVHCLDVGGIPVPLAAGLESVLAGLRELHADDNALLAAAAAVFDALYAAPAGPM